MENEELKEPMQENAASENESGQQEVVSEETGENPKEETADKQEESTEAAAPEKEKKGFFGKKKKDAKDLQIEELTDRVKRNLAEFDNYRKRTEKEKAAMFEIGAKSVVEKILPIVDNFERGLAMIPEEEKGTSFAEGMDKIYRQLLKSLEEVGVRPIEAVGQPFDPNFHNAVMHIEDENLGENVVAEEFQKGYLYREGVVRHSMVKVAN
ncbi:MAG: nucleotide exchange factor GrpE [bacterium]|nr:nucleotide exchange factor GrpE [bacterium]